MLPVFHKGEDIVPIPGTKHLKYPEENIKAADIKLSESEISPLEDLLPPSAAGSRYPESSMKYVNF